MDRLDAMALFVTAVEKGSLAAAARHHGRSAAAATRAVALLEAMADETLLLRSTRQLRLTAAGERRLVIWREVLARLGGGTPNETGASAGGTIVITAPELFGRLKIMPVVESFLVAYPQVAARVLMLNRMVDLVGEGIDLAVRLAPLSDSSLSAIRLGEVRRLVCASPQYLADRGTPEQPDDLDRHDCIGLNSEGDRELWAFVNPRDGRLKSRSVRVGTRLALNSAAAAINAAVRGGGIVRPLSYQVAADLAAGRLVRLLNAFEPPAVPVHLVFHPDAAKRGALRTFIEHATPMLRAELTRIDQTVGP